MDTGIRSNSKYEHVSEMSDHILKYSHDRTHPMLTESDSGHRLRNLFFFFFFFLNLYFILIVG